MLREGPIRVAFVGFYCEAHPDHDNSTKLGALSAFENEFRTLLESASVEGIRLSVRETLVLTYLPQLLEQQNMGGDLLDRVTSFKETMAVLNDRNHHIEVSHSNRRMSPVRPATLGVWSANQLYEVTRIRTG